MGFHGFRVCRASRLQRVCSLAFMGDTIVVSHYKSFGLGFRIRVVGLGG